MLRITITQRFVCFFLSVLSASDIQLRHCVVQYADGVVELGRCYGDCYVNALDVVDSRILFHGRKYYYLDSIVMCYMYICMYVWDEFNIFGPF